MKVNKNVMPSNLGPFSEERLEYDYSVLMHNSPLASKSEEFKLKRVQKLSLDEQDDTSFHPNGNQGCIILGDSYLFGIRCDHLIWIDGTDDIGLPQTVLFGNHKGCNSIAIISYPQENFEE